VHDSLLVHVIDGIAYLGEVLPANALVEVGVPLLGLADLPFQITSGGPLENYNQLGSRNE